MLLSSLYALNVKYTTSPSHTTMQHQMQSDMQSPGGWSSPMQIRPSQTAWDLRRHTTCSLSHEPDHPDYRISIIVNWSGAAPCPRHPLLLCRGTQAGVHE